MGTAEEMEAGRKRSRYWANPGASSPQTKPDPSDAESSALPIDTGVVAAATPKQPRVEGIKSGCRLKSVGARGRSRGRRAGYRHGNLRRRWQRRCAGKK